MSSRKTAATDDVSQAQALPQLDASSLVDVERLEAEVEDMYRLVAPAAEPGGSGRASHAGGSPFARAAGSIATGARRARPRVGHLDRPRGGGRRRRHERGVRGAHLERGRRPLSKRSPSRRAGVRAPPGRSRLDRALGHARGNGPRDGAEVEKQPATPATPFLIDSGSKAVTAFVVHMLHERGVAGPLGSRLPAHSRVRPSRQGRDHDRPGARASRRSAQSPAGGLRARPRA